MRLTPVLPLVLLFASHSQDLANHGKGKIKWTEDHDQGVKLSKEQGKPAFLYFPLKPC
jgi:hypothetical protein